MPIVFFGGNPKGKTQFPEVSSLCNTRLSMGFPKERRPIWSQDFPVVFGVRFSERIPFFLGDFRGQLVDSGWTTRRRRTVFYRVAASQIALGFTIPSFQIPAHKVGNHWGFHDMKRLVQRPGDLLELLGIGVIHPPNWGLLFKKPLRERGFQHLGVSFVGIPVVFLLVSLQRHPKGVRSKRHTHTHTCWFAMSTFERMLAV